MFTPLVLMESVLLTIWKFIVILAGFVLVLSIAFRWMSGIAKFFKRRLSPRKRHSQPLRQRTSESGYSAPAINKI
jgi:hypothetical protein